MKVWKLKPTVDVKQLLLYDFKMNGKYYLRRTKFDADLPTLDFVFVGSDTAHHPGVITLLAGSDDVTPYIADLIEADLVEQVELPAIRGDNGDDGNGNR